MKSSNAKTRKASFRRAQESRQLPESMLPRTRRKDGTLGGYKLRFRVRRRRELTPESLEIGLHTQDEREAQARAWLLLLLMFKLGVLEGDARRLMVQWFQGGNFKPQPLQKDNEQTNQA